MKAWSFVLLSGLCVSGLGCASADRFDMNGTGAGGSGGSDNPDKDGPSEIAFYDPLAATLSLQAGEVRSLKVRTTPAGPYAVRFALLPAGDEGDVEDPTGATLSSNTADTNKLGIASVDLTAPSSQTSFVVRASVGSQVTARLTVTVQGSGWRDVVVHADYAGTRQPSNWWASVHNEATCAEVGDFTKAGAWSGTAAFARDPKIEQVPVGAQHAVSIRGDYIASGCIEAEIPETGNINVPVNDLPLVLEGLFSLSFSIDDKNEAWTTRLNESQERALKRFRTLPGNNDITALLDAMGKSAGSKGSLFSSTRGTEDWDTLLVANLGETMLSDIIDTWFDLGSSDLGKPGALQGTLEDNMLRIVSVASSDGANAGFGISGEPATWEAQPADRLLLNAAVSWQFGTLVTALAEAPARAAVAGASDVPTALAEKVNCDQLGQTLADADAQIDDLLYTGCNAACGATLCRDALRLLWAQARDTASEDVDVMHISATATPTEISTRATPTTFDGEWTGQIVDTTASGLAISGVWSGSG